MEKSRVPALDHSCSLRSDACSPVSGHFQAKMISAFHKVSMRQVGILWFTSQAALEFVSCQDEEHRAEPTAENLSS